MKKAILVAASLFTAATAATTGEAVKASPQFVLSQSTAGNLVFTGVGTAQYNNSIGTNNSFQVGSSTNLGVNASTSSTPEYAVTSHARLDLASSSNLSQTIGTSGAADTKSAESRSAMEFADSTARTEATAAGTKAQEAWETTHGTTWVSGGTYANEDLWKDARTNTRTTAEETAYTATYNETYSAAESAISNSTNTNSSNGIIKGTFTTSEYGEAESGATMGDWQTASNTAADEKVKLTFDTDYTAYSKTHTDNSTVNPYADDTGWITDDKDSADYDAAKSSGALKYKEAKATARSTAYNEAYADALTASQRTSSSDVEVKGIGSDASVTSKSSSTFDVNIASTVVKDGVAAESTATATGAAGANLSTSSFANQSQASTASAFMQAFGGDADSIADELKNMAREGYVTTADALRLYDDAGGTTITDTAGVESWLTNNPVVN